MIEASIRNSIRTENIRMPVANELPVIAADRTHLTRVLQNLLCHAVNFMDKLPEEITVGRISEETFWRFSVTDN